MEPETRRFLTARSLYNGMDEIYLSTNPNVLSDELLNVWSYRIMHPTPKV